MVINARKRRFFANKFFLYQVRDCSAGCNYRPSGDFSSRNVLLSAPSLTQVSPYTYDVSILAFELETYNDPSPVFRIETGGETYYQWMVITEVESTYVTLMEYILDLFPFAGRSVSISYAFATEMGVTNYSQSVSLQLPGRDYIIIVFSTNLVL